VIDKYLQPMKSIGVQSIQPNPAGMDQTAGFDAA
jgi:hypothetical protein